MRKWFGNNHSFVGNKWLMNVLNFILHLTIATNNNNNHRNDLFIPQGHHGFYKYTNRLTTIGID